MQDLKLINNVKTMSSVEIAKLTGKQHNEVLKDIRRILEEAEINLGQLSQVYKAKNGQMQPCFLLPKRECDLVVSGYSVKYRLAIIDRWIELEKKEQEKEHKKIQSAIVRSELRLEYKPMNIALTESRQEQGKETTKFHISNEADLLNRIALGMTSAKFKVYHDIGDKEPIRDYLTLEQKNALLSLQRANTAYIEEGICFDERKERLIRLFNNKYSKRLIEELYLINE